MIPIRETFFYELPFDINSAFTSENIHNYLRDNKNPQAVVARLSQREADCIMKHLAERGKYRGYVREAHNPEHKHPHFRDCNLLLIVERAA